MQPALNAGGKGPTPSELLVVRKVDVFLREHAKVNWVLPDFIQDITEQRLKEMPKDGDSLFLRREDLEVGIQNKAFNLYRWVGLQTRWAPAAANRRDLPAGL